MSPQTKQCELSSEPPGSHSTTYHVVPGPHGAEYHVSPRVTRRGVRPHISRGISSRSARLVSSSILVKILFTKNDKINIYVFFYILLCTLNNLQTKDKYNKKETYAWLSRASGVGPCGRAVGGRREVPVPSSTYRDGDATRLECYTLRLEAAVEVARVRSRRPRVPEPQAARHAPVRLAERRHYLLEGVRVVDGTRRVCQVERFLDAEQLPLVRVVLVRADRAALRHRDAGPPSHRHRHAGPSATNTHHTHTYTSRHTISLKNPRPTNAS